MHHGIRGTESLSRHSDVRRMWGPHNLEPGRVLPVPADPFDQEVAEAAVPGQDRTVIAPVLAVVAPEDILARTGVPGCPESSSS